MTGPRNAPLRIIVAVMACDSPGHRLALVEPMESAGIYELYREYAEAAEQRDKPQPAKAVYARGSMEWLAEQKESG